MDSKCCVLFFDEIDALGQSRDSQGGNGEGEGCSRRVLAELLMQLNNIADRRTNVRPSTTETECNIGNSQASYVSSPRVIVVAATNRPEDCDNALLRRFGIRLHVGLPNKKHRKKLVIRLLNGVDHKISKKDFESIAAATDQWSCCDIENLAREAAMTPVRESIRAAVLLRKKAARQEQTGGVASGQEEGRLQLDPDTVAREALMASFQSLRPVIFQDFQRAVDFCLGRGNSSCLGSLEVGSPTTADFDSSSDESSDGE